MRVQLKCSINRLVLYVNYNHIPQREIISICELIVPGHSPSITCSLLSHSLKLILNVQCKVIIIILVHGTRLAAVFLAIPRMKEITHGIMKSFHTLLHRTRSGNRTIVHVSIKYPPVNRDYWEQSAFQSWVFPLESYPVDGHKVVSIMTILLLQDCIIQLHWTIGHSI